MLMDAIVITAGRIKVFRLAQALLMGGALNYSVVAPLKGCPTLASTAVRVGLAAEAELDGGLPAEARSAKVGALFAILSRCGRVPKAGWLVATQRKDSDSTNFRGNGGLFAVSIGMCKWTHWSRS